MPESNNNFQRCIYVVRILKANYIFGWDLVSPRLKYFWPAARGTLVHPDIITAVELNTLAPPGWLSIDSVLPRSIRNLTIFWYN